MYYQNLSAALSSQKTQPQKNQQSSMSLESQDTSLQKNSSQSMKENTGEKLEKQEKNTSEESLVSKIKNVFKIKRGK